MNNPLQEFIEDAKSLEMLYIKDSVVKAVPATVERLIEIVKKLGAALESLDPSQLDALNQKCACGNCEGARI